MNNPKIIEIASLKNMLGRLDDTEKIYFRDLFEIMHEDFSSMRNMNRETTQMLRGIFPWTKDVSEASHRASLRNDMLADFANQRATLMMDLLEAVR